MIRKGLVLVMMVVLAACAKQPQHKQDTQVRSFKPFSKIHVVGKVDVQLNTGSSKSTVKLHGDPRDLEHISTVIDKDGVLNVVAQGRYPKYGKVKATVNSKYLNLLAFNGHGHVRGSNINSRLFEADITNDGSVHISGKIGLRKLRLSGDGTTSISGVSTRDLDIEMIGSPKAILKGFANIRSLTYGGGSGFLNMYWVKSRNLTIKGSGYATVQLAGKVDELHLDINEDSHFKGRYLRVRRGFIKTHDRAVAEVQVLSKQHALAKDNSNIYFFNAANMHTDLMAQNGAVLDMSQHHRFASTKYEGYEGHHILFPDPVS